MSRRYALSRPIRTYFTGISRGDPIDRASPGPVEVAGQGVRSHRCVRQRPDHQMRAGRNTVQTLGGQVAQPSLDPITSHRVADRLGNNESHLNRWVFRAPGGVHHHSRTADADTAANGPPEVVRAAHPRGARQHGGNDPDRRRSGGQGFATLAATCRQDGATRTGTHPQTEPMGTATAPVARLESALAHGITPNIFVSGSTPGQRRRGRTIAAKTATC
ncbi:MAG: hypothetical protein QOF52_2419 [Propionibacteriaceae bacterium]|jgi:hypothetical protein|nr:hypothetical protein [Propionibacteriaceae bacterium]